LILIREVIHQKVTNLTQFDLNSSNFNQIILVKKWFNLSHQVEK